MTKEEIIELAKQAGVEDSNEYNHLVCTEVELVAFAKLVSKKEREACAKRLEAVGAAHCAENIRAKGQE